MGDPRLLCRESRDTNIVYGEKRRVGMWGRV